MKIFVIFFLRYCIRGQVRHANYHSAQMRSTSNAFCVILSYIAKVHFALLVHECDQCENIKCLDESLSQAVCLWWEVVFLTGEWLGGTSSDACVRGSGQFSSSVWCACISAKSLVEHSPLRSLSEGTCHHNNNISNRKSTSGESNHKHKRCFASACTQPQTSAKLKILLGDIPEWSDNRFCSA